MDLDLTVCTYVNGTHRWVRVLATDHGDAVDRARRWRASVETRVIEQPVSAMVVREHHPFTRERVYHLGETFPVERTPKRFMHSWVEMSRVGSHDGYTKHFECCCGARLTSRVSHEPMPVTEARRRDEVGRGASPG